MIRLKISMILVIQNIIPHYRRGFFNELAKVDEVLIVHSGTPASISGDRFREHIVKSLAVGPFIWQHDIVKIINSNNPSSVIASADIRNLHSFIAMLRFDRSLRWIWWGLDRGASDLAFRIKCFVAARHNPIVFYNNEIRNLFLDKVSDCERLFVANNTFHVVNSKCLADATPKDLFLNVGTLDARKQNDVLIYAFNVIYRQTGRDIYLYLIGEGSDRQRLELLVSELNLSSRVFLPGKIEDAQILQSYYARAIASVSFGQAGLAVLQSMAFGVPFITKRNSVSGGEKYNIEDGVNGIFCSDDIESLVAAMRCLIENPLFARTLGQGAFAHYCEKASIEGMVDGFRAALGYR